MHDLPATGNTRITTPENKAFYPALDGLRCVSFLLVFFNHYTSVPWGWGGVNVFFVLSGFLITGILFDTRDDPHRMRNFYARRTLRIFPLYYGTMVLVALLWPLMHWQWNWHWLVWPLYLGNFARFVHPYAQGSAVQRLADFQSVGSHGSFFTVLSMGHFWSLCIEEQFYLVWPLLVFSLRRRSTLVLVCAAAVPLCLAMRIAGQSILPSWMLDNAVLDRATPFCLDALLTGGLVALCLRCSFAASFLRVGKILFRCAAGVLLLFALFSPFGHFLQRPYPYPAGIWTWSLTAINLLSGLAILSAVQPGTLAHRVLGLPPLRWLGRLSYGAYVLHDIPHMIYDFIGNTLAPAHAHSVTVAVAFVSTVGLAWLSFRFFETPFLNLKNRFVPEKGAAVTIEPSV